MDRAKAERAFSEQEKEFLKRTHDDWRGRIAYTVTESLLGVELIAERYTAKWAAKEVVELNSEKNNQEREWNERSEIVSHE